MAPPPTNFRKDKHALDWCSFALDYQIKKVQKTKEEKMLQSNPVSDVQVIVHSTSEKLSLAYYRSGQMVAKQDLYIVFCLLEDAVKMVYTSSRSKLLVHTHHHIEAKWSADIYFTTSNFAWRLDIITGQPPFASYSAYSPTDRSMSSNLVPSSYRKTTRHFCKHK